MDTNPGYYEATEQQEGQLFYGRNDPPAKVQTQ